MALATTMLMLRRGVRLSSAEVTGTRTVSSWFSPPTALPPFSSRTPKTRLGGGSGLVSTAMDYAHSCQMLANDGELNGVRILSRRPVELMHADHIPTDMPRAGGGVGGDSMARLGLRPDVCRVRAGELGQRRASLEGQPLRHGLKRHDQRARSQHVSRHPGNRLPLHEGCDRHVSRFGGADSR